MQTKPERPPAPGRRWNRTLLYTFIAVAFAGAAQADAPPAVRAKTTYTVIQLSSSFMGGAINDKGQVAFTETTAGPVTRARFYDGKSVRDLGTLGGPSATAADVNNLGQVTGDTTLDAAGDITHAYRWSAATGMVDLSRPGYGQSHGEAINNKGQVVGYNEFNPPNPGHGFFWSPRTGMLDVGALGPFGSIATLINDAGMVAGTSEGPQGGPFSLLAFRWTRAGGIHGIGTLPSEFTFPTDINAAGHIVGESPFTPGGLPHAYLWTQRAGLIDLGTGSNTRSIANAINDHDVVVGQTETRFTGPAFAFVWTRATGLVELKSQSPAVAASANDVNNRDQVVGGIDNHAFLLSRAEGLVDLNTRIPGAPAGLTLFSASAISENGSVLAFANTGLVLLVPHCGCSKVAPTVGAVQSTGTTRAGILLSFTAAFNDTDVSDTHKASWSWGDGSSDAGTVNEKNGGGSASAQHKYAAPGIYTVTLTVTDSSGKSTAVQRKITVGGADAYVAGQGWFMSPPDASPMGRHKADIASFAVLSSANSAAAAAQGKASFEFEVAGITFHSDQIDSQSIQGGRVQYGGRGRLNGADGYHFMLNSVPGIASGSGNDRIRIRIWHYAPGTNAEVVDYDNRRDRGTSVADDQDGTVMGEGTITIQTN